MREMIKMVVVLTVLAAFSGGLLAAIRDNTKDKIELQQLTFVKGPAIKGIFKDASNDPISDRFKIKDGDVERSFFVGVIDGKPKAVALESYGKGYGGDVGLMVGIDMDSDTILGAGVTTHAETPGMGAKAKEDPSFTDQFKGVSVKDADPGYGRRRRHQRPERCDHYFAGRLLRRQRMSVPFTTG